MYTCNRCAKTYKYKGTFDKHSAVCVPSRARPQPAPQERREPSTAIPTVVDAPVKKQKTEFGFETELSDLKREVRTKINELDKKMEELDEKMKEVDDKITKVGEKAIMCRNGYCLICWENEANNAFTPCGHRAVCGTCAAQVIGSSNRCPVCRTRVYDMIQIWDVGVKDIK